jgi:hypothetical protein
MKPTSKLLILLMAAAAMWTGCKRVELDPLTQHPLLPLAVGNTWTYVYSFTVQTSEPRSFLHTADITYTVTEEVYADIYDWSGNRGRMRRVPGYRLLCSGDRVGEIGLFVMGDTLYAATFSFYMTHAYFAQCAQVQGHLVSNPAILGAQDGVLWPIMVHPSSPNQQFAAYPGFREFDGCVGATIPTFDGQDVVFDLFFEDIAVTDPALVVTTEAGTFDCVNWGSEQWAEGVGMVRAEHDGTTAFFDSTYTQQTGTLRWTRTLKSYHVQ